VKRFNGAIEQAFYASFG